MKTRAIRVSKTGGPEVLEWTEVDLAPPARGEVQLKHTAIGLNFVDVYNRSGLYPVPLPFVPGQEAAGVVTEVGGSPIVQTNANEAIKFKVKVQLKQPPPGIKPGLSTQADIFTGSRSQVLAVPIQALVVKDLKPKPGQALAPGAPREQEGVYVVEAGKAKFLPLTVGLMGDLTVEVLSGLKGGETIITGPFKALRELKEQDPVRPDTHKKAD